MEESLNTDIGDDFAFSSLKIRTMQDDLKKHVPSAEKPAVPMPLPKIQTPPPKLAVAPPKPTVPPKSPAELPTPTVLPPPKPQPLSQIPKETITKAPEPVAPPKLSPFQKIISRVLPEPPPYLPSEPVSLPPQPAPQAVKPMPAPIAAVPEKPKLTQQAKLIEPPSPSVLKLQSDLIDKEIPNSVPLPVPPKSAAKYAFMFGIPAVIVIAGIFGFIYFSSWGAPKPLCPEGQITAGCRCGNQSQETKTAGFCCTGQWINYDCSLTQLPQLLIPSINQVLTIDTKDASLGQIISKIKDVYPDVKNEHTNMVALKLNDTPAQYASLDDLIRFFGITIPEEIRSNNQAYNLFVYNDPNGGSNASSTTDYRFVLALKQKDGSGLDQAMARWEATMVRDLKPMILGQPSDPSSPEFLSAYYHNGYFRYQNLSDKSTTVNYTINQNLIIIGTSKDSIFFIYDSLDTDNANPKD